MTKYIDADRLRAEIDRIEEEARKVRVSGTDKEAIGADGKVKLCLKLKSLIDSLQQDDTQVDIMLCSQIWWEEQGWIMIPPDATIEGIDSLLKQVRKKLQQNQPEVDLDEEIRIYLKTHHLHIKDGGRVVFDNDDSPNFMCDIRDIAYYFYNLHLNSRK